MATAAFLLKPPHAPVRNYSLALAQLANVGAKHETAVREAWHTLIEHCAGPLKWTLVREYSVSRKGAAPLRLDAVLLDAYRIPHGVIEDKDDKDDLAAEMRAKLKLGYPAKNTLFWQPRRALLVQDGKVVLDYYLDTKPEQLCEILARFFAYTEPVIADWDQYRVERAKENYDEILSDPNRADDEQYILRLIGEVVTVSVETMKLVKTLPGLEAPAPVRADSRAPALSEYPTQAEVNAAHVYSVQEDPPRAD